jgi:hypothetical protein
MELKKRCSGGHIHFSWKMSYESATILRILLIILYWVFWRHIVFAAEWTDLTC